MVAHAALAPPLLATTLVATIPEAKEVTTILAVITLEPLTPAVTIREVVTPEVIIPEATEAVTILEVTIPEAITPEVITPEVITPAVTTEAATTAAATTAAETMEAATAETAPTQVATMEAAMAEAGTCLTSPVLRDFTATPSVAVPTFLELHLLTARLVSRTSIMNGPNLH